MARKKNGVEKKMGRERVGKNGRDSLGGTASTCMEKQSPPAMARQVRPISGSVWGITKRGHREIERRGQWNQDGYSVIDSVTK